MLHIVLPDDSQRQLVFYLAMEEYVSKVLDRLPGVRGSREAFFIWQVEPTVIFGRNQVMEAEVNLPYCRSHGIRLFRRKSGGGCVYSDMGNIMISYITDSTDVAFSFDRYMQRLALVLRQAGLNADRSGRNDILIGGKKVSGNAFFHRQDASIVHGTMLFDSDFGAMSEAITPSKEKISSKGVNSVRQHVTNLKDEFMALGTPLSERLSDIGRFKDFLTASLKGKDCTCMLGPDEIGEIEGIMQDYLDPAFLYGRNHRWSVTKEARIEGCGQLAISLEMDGDRIMKISIGGDWFTLKDGLEEVLCHALEGRTREDSEVKAALEGIDAGEYVMNLRTEDITTLISH